MTLELPFSSYREMASRSFNNFISKIISAEIIVTRRQKIKDMTILL